MSECPVIEIQLQQIGLQANPANKAEAIQQVGQLLVANGFIEPGYVESLFGRELVANTYLGNGIAIPHGLPENRDLIKRTGIAVLQVPHGVEWNEGETAKLVVGIAAKTDEHIDVLRRLTRILADQDLVARLTQTTNAADLIEALTGSRPAPASTQAVSDYATVIEVELNNPSGLHARPAAHFVNVAKQFESKIRVRYGSRAANAKSPLTLLQLGVRQGARIFISADGPDASQALETLRAAVASGLGEDAH
jgi:phosphocarrier protein FPr